VDGVGSGGLAEEKEKDERGKADMEGAGRGTTPWLLGDRRHWSKGSGVEIRFTKVTSRSPDRPTTLYRLLV